MSNIISVVDTLEHQVVRPELVTGRKIKDFSINCGTSGMGGMDGLGFVGFNLLPGNERGNEWLILCICGSATWLTVDGKCLMAHPDQHNQNRPLISNNLFGKKWDEFTPMVVGQEIYYFEIKKHSCLMKVGSIEISILEDPYARPPYLSGRRRKFESDDDLNQAWIFNFDSQPLAYDK